MGVFAMPGTDLRDKLSDEVVLEIYKASIFEEAKAEFISWIKNKVYIATVLLIVSFPVIGYFGTDFFVQQAVDRAVESAVKTRLDMPVKQRFVEIDATIKNIDEKKDVFTELISEAKVRAETLKDTSDRLTRGYDNIEEQFSNSKSKFNTIEENATRVANRLHDLSRGLYLSERERSSKIDFVKADIERIYSELKLYESIVDTMAKRPQMNFASSYLHSIATQKEDILQKWKKDQELLALKRKYNIVVYTSRGNEEVSKGQILESVLKDVGYRAVHWTVHEDNPRDAKREITREFKDITSVLKKYDGAIVATDTDDNKQIVNDIKLNLRSNIESQPFGDLEIEYHDYIPHEKHVTLSDSLKVDDDKVLLIYIVK